MVRLGDIATVVTKGTTPTSIGFDFTNEGINFIKIESITEDGKFLTSKFAHINDSCNERLKRSQLQENDILFSIAGAIGRTALVTAACLPANTNQALAIIRVPKGVADYRYLLYALQSDSVMEQFDKQKQGVAQLNISLKNVSDLVISLPSKEKQEEIVNKLDKVTQLISFQTEQLSKLDELVKSRFIELFGDPVDNPNNLQSYNLEGLSDIVAGITKGRKAHGKQLYSVPYMAVSNVKAGYIDWTTIKTIDATQAEIEQYRLQPYDVLMTEGGDPDKLGRGAMIIDPPDNCIHQNHIFRVRVNRDVLLPQYLEAYLQHPKAKQYFFRCAKQTTGIASINMKQLRALPVLLPSIDLQYEFAAFVEHSDKLKLEVKNSLEKLETLKKKLMQEYFG